MPVSDLDQIDTLYRVGLHTRRGDLGAGWWGVRPAGSYSRGDTVHAQQVRQIIQPVSLTGATCVNGGSGRSCRLRDAGRSHRSRSPEERFRQDQCVRDSDTARDRRCEIEKNNRASISLGGANDRLPASGLGGFLMHRVCRFTRLPGSQRSDGILLLRFGLPEAATPCEDTTSPYAISYSEKYCHRFTELAGSLGSRAQAWISNTRTCLQEL